MFDVGFSELIIIAIVALVVIGPERLPGVARTAGHLVGRLRRYVDDVKSDIGREIELDELRRLKTEFQTSAREFEQSISSEVAAVRESVESTARSLENDASGSLLAAPASEVTVAAPPPVRFVDRM